MVRNAWGLGIRKSIIQTECQVFIPIEFPTRGGKTNKHKVGIWILDDERAEEGSITTDIYGFNIGISLSEIISIVLFGKRQVALTGSTWAYFMFFQGFCV